MVRAGEGSGRLEQALDMVAVQLEKLDALRRQVRSAMMYPMLVFGFAVIVMSVVVAFIVPVFTGIFEELSQDSGEPAELPFMTQITVTDLGSADRRLVHPLSGYRARSSSCSSSGRKPSAVATSGTSSS